MSSMPIVRTFKRAAVAAVLLVLVAAMPATANGGGGEGDLGLDDLSITSATVDTRTGVVTVAGEVACSQDIEHLDVSVGINQPVGRFRSVTGWESDHFACLAADGTAAFSLTVLPDAGKFGVGSAFVGASASTFICTEEQCLEDFVEYGPTSVRLVRG